tara:strand:+ start:608 stop:1057 length:450 start_codon:yes stop_codon:yes gene_type:complete
VNLELLRYSTSSESTLGILSNEKGFLCHTIEDAWHLAKIPGQTRIPEGVYDIELRTDGGMNEKYSLKHLFHKGMLWLRNVPDYSWVYIHTGNKASHSEGCILVGDTSNNNQLTTGFVGSSKAAYTRIYPRIAEAILAEETVSIEIKDVG